MQAKKPLPIRKPENPGAADAPDAPDVRPWYAYPWVWFVIAVPVLAVVVSVYTAVMAYETAPIIVKDEPIGPYTDISRQQVAHTGMLPADLARKMASDFGAGAGVPHPTPPQH